MMSTHEENAQAANGRKETSLERLDRNLDELTGELRVIVTGVQVLFAFLLVVPFSSGFKGVGPFERGVYLATLLCAALATVCIIAPAARHRILFRLEDKRDIVFSSNRVVIAGIVFLVFAMCGSILFVTTEMFNALTGAVTTGVVGIAFAMVWIVIPLRRREQVQDGAVAPSSQVGDRGVVAGEWGRR
jgi:hypothetical protein